MGFDKNKGRDNVVPTGQELVHSDTFGLIMTCVALSMPSNLAVCICSGRDARLENMAEVADDKDGSERIVFELLRALNRTVLSREDKQIVMSPASVDLPNFVRLISSWG